MSDHRRIVISPPRFGLRRLGSVTPAPVAQVDWTSSQTVRVRTQVPLNYLEETHVNRVQAPVEDDIFRACRHCGRWTSTSEEAPRVVCRRNPTRRFCEPEEYGIRDFFAGEASCIFCNRWLSLRERALCPAQYDRRYCVFRQ